MTLWGHLVHLCVRPVITYGVLGTKCLELAPPGLISLILYIYIFFFQCWTMIIMVHGTYQWTTCTSSSHFKTLKANQHTSDLAETH